ncbi:MAG: hypothetical protein RIR48_2983 [Bacteroidota bacterium]
MEKLMQEKKELTQVISHLSNGDAKNFIQNRLNEIEQLLSKMTHYSNLLNFLFENPIIDKIQKNELTLYTPKIALTYAPPQVGKTAAMIQMMKDCVARNISVVLSSDNKKDQMNQLFSRLVRAVETNYENVFKNCFITTIDNKNFDSIVDQMNSGQFTSFIICCLDNKTQIQKVYEKIISIHENNKMSSLCLIHDEADTVTKARNIVEIVSGQPESHKKWIELTNKVYQKGIDLKRIFVTATPENVVYLHKPQFVWELPIPENYVSSEQLSFSEISEFDNASITRILTREVKARQQECGIILYCVERNKEESEDDDGSNQIHVFRNVFSSIKKTGLDSVSIYNSNGFRVAFRLQKHQTLFINKMEELSIKYTEMEDYSFLIRKNDLSISQFYGILQTIGCRVVLTIGKDLISRGISFVSDHKDNPLTATTMIYKPGSQLSQVALTQAIGRLNGTAQPALIRRLYTTDDVYTNYCVFNKNQREIISAIRDNNYKVDDDLISNIALWKASRMIDRKALKLEKDISFWEDTMSEDDEGYTSEDEIDGVNLKKLNKWIHGDTLVGRMINYLYTCEEPISVEEFKDGIEYANSYTELASNIRSGSSLNAKYGKLWCHTVTNNTIILNKNIRSYIDKI